MKKLVIIPAFNEEGNLEKTVKDIKEDGTIEYYGTPNTNKLTSDMKTRILEIAKLVSKR